MVTPLFKFLKSQGTSFYAFPGSSEDISASYQNQNYKMYFSKYTLINLPKQQLNYTEGSTSSHPVFWDFKNSSALGYGFQESGSYTQPTSFQDQVVESLRNYVANHEVSIRDSRTNNTEFYYDPNQLETTTEKIFFKWCKKLGLIDFEPAIGGAVQYFDTLQEFARNNENDDSYFPEYLWQERQVLTWTPSSWSIGVGPYATYLQANYTTVTNYKSGDVIELSNISDSGLLADLGTGSSVRVLSVFSTTGGQSVVMDYIPIYFSGTASDSSSTKLVYNRLIQYIGEVNGVSNVNSSNKSYTEVYAHVPDHTGLTPDILFRTGADNNYKPNMVFPIIPSQYQPEIIGAELFNSPIVSNPQNYPGSYFGQFDVNDFTYLLANGDSLRRSGDYFGINGDINTPIVNGGTIDGVTLDFNTSHYAKMNIPNRNLSNFDQFNALEVNNKPPQDFNFNAILWYYTVMDSTGTMSENLYGISFLDNPDNNPKDSEVGIAFPEFKKLVSNGNQDGTSYAFALNINFNIVSDNPVEAYNPEAINALFSMNLFNDAMAKLSSINDTFIQMLSDNANLAIQVSNLQSLLYSQTDLNTINQRINNLTNLINLYQSNQIVSSNSVAVSYNQQTSPPTIQLNTQDPSYIQVSSVNTSNMYNINGVVPYSVSVPTNKNFLVYVNNDDEVNFTLPNATKLVVAIGSDLYYKQKMDVIVTGSDISTENKKLDIYMVAKADSLSTAVETLLISDIDLPVFLNKSTQQPNSAKTWNKFKFNIDFNESIILKSNGILQLSVDSRYDMFSNSIKPGDELLLSNLFIGTTSVFNFSGQYTVDSVGTTQSQILLNINSNPTFVSYGASQSLPLTIHGTSSSTLSNLPYLDLNKGYKISVTRINSELVPLSERYDIQINSL